MVIQTRDRHLLQPYQKNRNNSRVPLAVSSSAPGPACHAVLLMHTLLPSGQSLRYPNQP